MPRTFIESLASSKKGTDLIDAICQNLQDVLSLLKKNPFFDIRVDELTEYLKKIQEMQDELLEEAAHQEDVNSAFLQEQEPFSKSQTELMNLLKDIRDFRIEPIHLGINLFKFLELQNKLVEAEIVLQSSLFGNEAQLKAKQFEEMREFLKAVQDNQFFQHELYLVILKEELEFISNFDEEFSEIAKHLSGDTLDRMLKQVGLTLHQFNQFIEEAKRIISLTLSDETLTVEQYFEVELKWLYQANCDLMKLTTFFGLMHLKRQKATAFLLPDYKEMTADILKRLIQQASNIRTPYIADQVAATSNELLLIGAKPSPRYTKTCSGIVAKMIEVVKKTKSQYYGQKSNLIQSLQHALRAFTPFNPLYTPHPYTTSGKLVDEEYIRTSTHSVVRKNKALFSHLVGIPLSVRSKLGANSHLGNFRSWPDALFSSSLPKAEYSFLAFYDLSYSEYQDSLKEINNYIDARQRLMDPQKTPLEMNSVEYVASKMEGRTQKNYKGVRLNLDQIKLIKKVLSDRSKAVLNDKSQKDKKAQSCKWSDITTKLNEERYPSLDQTKASNDLLALQLAYYNNFINELMTRFNPIYWSHQARALRPGHFNKYPCLMVYIDQKTLRNHLKCIPPGKDFSKKMIEGWTNTCVSLMTGLIDFIAFQEGLPFEIVRRASLIFIAPSIAVTGGAMRLSTGMVPHQMLKVFEKAITLMDLALVKFYQEAASDLVQDLTGLVIHNPNYHSYRKKNKINIDGLSYFDFLFTLVDECHHTFSHYLGHTQHSKYEVSAQLLNELYAHEGLELTSDILAKAIKKTLLEASFRVKLVNKPQEKSASRLGLTFEKKKPTQINNEFIEKAKSSIHKKLTDSMKLSEQEMELDRQYWDFISRTVVSVARYIQDPDFDPKNTKPVFTLTKEALTNLKKSINQKTPNHVQYDLELLHRALFIEDCMQDLVCTHQRNTDLNDDACYNSDSDEECEIKDEKTGELRKIYAKKVVLHNGLRALLRSVQTAQEELKELGIDNSGIYCEAAYYELSDGINLLIEAKALSELKVIKPSNTSAFDDCMIVSQDLNPCITDDNNYDYESKLQGRKREEVPIIIDVDENKALILDGTTSDVDQLARALKHYSSKRHNLPLFMCFSNTKAQLGGGDAYQYGMIRIFSQNRDQLKKIVKNIRTNESLIVSRLGNKIRKLYKRLGFSLSNFELFQKALSIDVTNPEIQQNSGTLKNPYSSNDIDRKSGIEQAVLTKISDVCILSKSKHKTSHERSKSNLPDSGMKHKIK